MVKDTARVNPIRLYMRTRLRNCFHAMHTIHANARCGRLKQERQLSIKRTKITRISLFPLQQRPGERHQKKRIFGLKVHVLVSSVAVLPSGNMLVLINKATLCQAPLVPGCVTILGRVNHPGAERTTRSTQPGHPSMGKCSEYQRKLGSKQARHVTH